MNRLLAIFALVCIAFSAEAQRAEVAAPAPKVVDRSECVEIPIDKAQVADAEFVLVNVRRPVDTVGNIAGYFVEARMTPSLARKDETEVIAGLYTCKDADKMDAVRFKSKLIATENGMHITLIVLPKPEREKDFRIRSCHRWADSAFKCWRGTYTGDKVVTLSPE